MDKDCISSSEASQHPQPVPSGDSPVVAKERIPRKRSVTALVTLAVSLLSFIMISAVAIVFNYNQMFVRNDVTIDDNSYFPFYEEYSAQYPRVDIPIPADDGQTQLAGYLYGAQNTRGLLVVAVGMGGRSDTMYPFVSYFVDRGWKVFTFDGYGAASSGGDSRVGLAQRLIDLDGALHVVEDQDLANEGPTVLLGHSMGGFATGAILDDRFAGHDIDAVISLAGFNTPNDLLEMIEKGMMGDVFGAVEAPFGQMYQRHLFGDLSDISATNAIAASSVPVLVVTPANDATIEDQAIAMHFPDGVPTNVTLIERNQPNRDDHGTFYLSEDASNYLSAKQTEFDQIPDDDKAAQQAFWSGIDKSRVNAVDTEFMNELVAFAESARETR